MMYMKKKLIENLVEHHRHLSVKPTLIFITHRPAVVEYCSQAITLTKCSAS